MHFYESDCPSKNQLGSTYIVCLKKTKKKTCNICKAHSCYSGSTDISSISNERHSSFACEHSHVHL